MKARYVIAASEHLRARFPVSERSVITASFLVIVQSPKRPKVSEPSGAVFESNGFPGSSVMARVTSFLEPGCSDVSLGQLPFGARAIGFPGFSLTAPGTSVLEPGCLDFSFGHSNNDFERPCLPSYQHFRPSMRRQDQWPCEFVGLAELHCCFACAAGIPLDDSAEYAGRSM